MRVGPHQAVGRLLKRADFLAAAGGRRVHTERMTVQGLGREDSSHLRVGYTLTKKVGHATERNRIRRRFRAAAAEAAARFAQHPADVVVIGRREALSAPFRVLVDDLLRALGAVTRPSRRPNPYT